VSAVNLFFAYAASKLAGVAFTWLWVALTKDYTRPLVYSSVVLSLLPGVGLGIYMIIKGRSVDQCNASSWVQVLS
jgi:hypothetical protein